MLKNSLFIAFAIQLTLASTVHGKTPQIRANQLSKEKIFQDGPNCFNTSLLSLGYSDKKVFTSVPEIKYYLKYHCKEIPFNPKSLESNTLLTYTGPNNYLDHTAVALSSQKIIEKNSLYGSKHAEVYMDKYPGRYLIQNLQQSIFFGKDDSLRGKAGKAYRCDSEAKVLATKQNLLKNNDIKRISDFLDYISVLTTIKDTKVLEEKINNDLLKKYDELKISETLNQKSTHPQVNHFKLGILESAAYQWNLLNCSDAYAKYDDCYAPQNQKSISTLERLYQQIYEFRAQVPQD